MNELRQKIKELRQKAYSMKTKKAQSKYFDKMKEVEHELFLKLCDQRDKFGTHSVKATVGYFRDGEDDVMLNTPYGILYGSPTSDAVSKSWYGHTCCVEYSKGQEVIVEIDVDVDMDRLVLNVIPKRIYGGTLNQAKYDELCKRDNLAFFKYPNSEGVTGLFSSKKKGA